MCTWRGSIDADPRDYNSGVKDESLVCLKKLGPGAWGVCEDYSVFVDAFRQAEIDHLRANDSGGKESRHKLRFRAFFSESDFMIGDGGREYFVKNWSRPGVEDAVDFESTIVPDTNHDNVVSAHKKALGMAFEELKECWTAE